MSNIEATQQVIQNRRFKRNMQCILMGVGLFGLWAWSGFMSPITLLSGLDASGECVRFAEQHKDELAFFGKNKVKAMETWTKNGKFVVELGFFEEGKSTYFPRICVVGNGYVQIVSVFENNAWR